MLVALKLKKAFGSSSQKMQLLVTPIKVKNIFLIKVFICNFGHCLGAFINDVMKI